MFFQLRRNLAMQWFAIRCGGIRDTEPILCRPGPLLIVSLVSQRDLLLYLLAVKSFYRAIGEGGILVLDDGTLTASGRALLGEHIRGVEFQELARIDTGPLPRGGCWERLAMILDLARDRYIVQLDSDTATTGAIDEVLACYRSNRAFLLATGAGRAIAPAAQCAVFARGLSSDHVQVAAERTFDDLPFRAGLRYVRASAGFAGFPRGGCDAGLLRQFSAAMADRLGKRWEEWGSEQVASNFLLANTTGAEVLPYPKYCCYGPGIRWKESVFLHFIGSHRFENGVYRRAGQRIIGELSGKAGAR
jgi:hypothetical protein